MDVKARREDADGVPIKKGDTVYGIETGNELVVDAFVEDGSHGPYTVDCHLAVGGEPNYYRPDKLTHTKSAIQGHRQLNGSAGHAVDREEDSGGGQWS